MKSRLALCACLLLSAGLACAQTGPATVSSLDGVIQAMFSTGAGRAATATGGGQAMRIRPRSQETGRLYMALVFQV